MPSVSSPLTAASRFPDLTPLNNPPHNTTTTRSNIASVRVPFSQPSALLPSLKSSPASCPILFTAWTVFLRCYTGQDIVTFSIIKTGETAPAAARIALNDASSVIETVEANHLLPGEADPVDSDTAVVLWNYRKGTKPTVKAVSSPQPLLSFEADPLIRFLATKSTSKSVSPCW